MPRRELLLRLWLAAIALSTLDALWIVLGDWPGFVASFPRVDAAGGRAVAIALPLLLLVAIFGLWRWRRWGVRLLIVATAATLAFDLFARGPWLHMLAAVVSTAVSAGLVLWNRNRYGFTADAPVPR
jgi:hypothetical protein